MKEQASVFIIMNESMRSPASVLLLHALRFTSLAAYMYTAYGGWRILTAPWLSSCSPGVASLAVHVAQSFVAQYLIEALLASVGLVCMHAWAVLDVLQHHLPVALFWMPAAFLCCSNVDGWAAADQWYVLLEHHPPLVAAISSAALTGLNEGGFVVRALFMPSALADAPPVRWAQALLTLLVLLQNMSITLTSAILGSWRLLVLGESWGTTAQRACAVLCYAFAPLFIAFVQVGYTRANWKKVRRGPFGYRYVPPKEE